MSRFRALALLLVGACGDGRELGVDAPTVDAAPATQLVKVRYIAQPEVADRATVIFQNASSAIEAITSTDRAGIATARVSGPVSVSVVVTRFTSHFIYTYTGVQPGEEVVVDDRINSDFHTYRNFNLGIPTVPDGSFYSLFTSCGDEDVSAAAGGQQQVGSVNNLVDCPATMDMLVIGFGIGTSYIFNPDVPVSEGSFIRLPGAYRPADTNNIQVVGVGEAASSNLMLRAGTLVDSRIRRTMLAEISDSLFGVTGSASVSYETPVPPNATRMYDVTSFGNFDAAHLASWGPGTTDVTLDLGRDMPRAYLTAPVYSSLTNTITWTEASTGPLADAVFTVLTWQDNFESYQWHVQASRTEEPKLVLPTLPVDLRPRSGPFLSSLANVATDRGIDGIGKRVLGSWQPGTLWPTETESGEVRYRDINTQLFPTK